MEIKANMRMVDRGNLVAIGEVILDKIFTVSPVKVLRFTTEEGEEDWKVYLPQKKTKDGWDSVVRLQDRSLKEQLNKTVFESIHWELARDVDVDPKIEASVTLYAKDELLGFADVMYEGQVEIHGIQIRKAKEGEGIRLIYPYTMNAEGKPQGLVSPLRGKVENRIQEKVGEAYQKALEARRTLQEPKKTGKGKSR